MPVGVGSPFGSPSSLAPLTFNEHERSLKLTWTAGQSGPREAIEDSAPDAQPRGLRQSAHQTAARHAEAALSVRARGSSRLPATAAPEDRYGSICASSRWDGAAVPLLEPRRVAVDLRPDVVKVIALAQRCDNRQRIRRDCPCSSDGAWGCDAGPGIILQRGQSSRSRSETTKC